MRTKKVTLPNQYPELIGIILWIMTLYSYIGIKNFLFNIFFAVLVLSVLWFDKTCKYSRRRRKDWYVYLQSGLGVLFGCIFLAFIPFSSNDYSYIPWYLISGGYTLFLFFILPKLNK